jgi:L-ascorbate metabolism protein UlaG (beta-lactamase superfamily)
MTQTRRKFLSLATASVGAMTVLPYSVRAAGQPGDKFDGAGITVHPVSHASFVMSTPVGTIYTDPVGGADKYSGFKKPDLILITHQHGDHYKPDTLSAIVGDNTQIVANPAVHAMMPAELKSKSIEVSNDGSSKFKDLGIEAIPAYNTTEARLKFHPKGRDNGYVLSFSGFRVYISGDTEDIPEMRKLKKIDLAFVCMNLPFTMDAKAAASAVAEFKPKNVYPYHYRGRDGGTQDPAEFAKLVGGASAVKMARWYG